MDAICTGAPFKENHSMEKAFGYYTRFAKLVVTEPSDWKHVKPFFRRALHDGTAREYTSEGDQPCGRMAIDARSSQIRAPGFPKSVPEVTAEVPGGTQIPCWEHF